MRFVVAQAWQSWKSAKAIAVLATVALAVGIGSTTAIYTVVNTVMLKPLPYPQGDRFVALFAARFSEPNQRGSSAVRDLLEYERRTTSFDVFGWFRPENFNLSFKGNVEHVSGVAVTPSLIRGVGVNPFVGRWFADDTGVVISSALWRRLGSDADIVGQGVTLNDRQLTITGVMPPEFRLPIPGFATAGSTDLWTHLDPLEGQDEGGLYFAYGRRKPDVTLAQAEADVKRVAAEIAALDSVSHPSYTARLDDLLDISVSEVRPTLLLLFIASGLLLLITCANVAALLLARSVERARETAIRVALGASSWQLGLHYFVEGLFVSLAGAAAGMTLSLALVRVVLPLAADRIPRSDEIGVDWRVVLFAVAAAFMSSALSSLAPLWQAFRTAPNEVLGAGLRTSASAQARRSLQSLVVAEIAVAVALLAAGGVLISHLRALNRTSPGFDPNDLITFQLTIPNAIASDEARRLALEKRLTESLERIPGVDSATFVNQLPLDGCCLVTTIYPEGAVISPQAVERTSFLVINPGFFRTMRIPIRRGRLLTESDTSADRALVVINQAAATRYWPGKDPVGSYGRISSPDGSRFEIVGVVGDVRNDGLGKRTVPEIYLLSSLAAANPMDFIVRSSLPPRTLAPEIRRAVQRVDPTLAVHELATMAEIVSGSVVFERGSSLLTAFFALVALLMATLGIYGVVAYSVRQRRVEMGTRLALGAVGRDLLTLVMGGGLKMAALGVLIGGALSVAAAWLLARSFSIPEIGVLPFAVSAIVVASVAMAASFFPAWRATLLSPMSAIRNEPQSAWQAVREKIGRAR
jgi:putative ABC transport system permease protein